MIQLCTAYLPWEIFVSVVLAESLVFTHLVPFVTLGRSNNFIGALTFKGSKCKGKPRPLKNSKILQESKLLDIHQ